MPKTTKWQKVILGIEIAIFLIIVVAAIYFAWRSRKKKFPFQGDNNTPVIAKKKKAKKINKNEEKCREIFTKLFRVKFPSVRPSFLKNPATGKNLELDGFAKDYPTPIGIGLAFEYDGRQHSNFIPHFHKHGPKEFVYQVKKDSWKDMMCKTRGILLIRIPYFVDYDDLERYIRKECTRRGLRVYG